jgi:uncharacterized protein
MVVRLVLVAGVLLGLVGCGSSDEVPYAEAIAADRAAKDRALSTASDSPITPDARQQFLPLAYFMADERYRVPASLIPSEGEPVLEMPTSTGKRRAMRRAGKLSFTLDGETRALTAFVDASDTSMARLFVPFGDRTNGTETYAAGRYLDLDRTVTGLYDLDFNRAYHPYCYYNPQYDCPYPPRENRLDVPVRAGEKMKQPLGSK